MVTLYLSLMSLVTKWTCNENLCQTSIKKCHTCTTWRSDQNFYSFAVSAYANSSVSFETMVLLSFVYFLVAKTIFYSLAVLVRKILFCHSKIKFTSSHHRVISSIYSYAGYSPVGEYSVASEIYYINPNISKWFLCLLFAYANADTMQSCKNFAHYLM